MFRGLNSDKNSEHYERINRNRNRHYYCDDSCVFALGVANSSIDVFNITNELERTAGLIAGAIVIDPKIEAFAPKKH